jgi:hypothetical protein
MNGRIRAYTVVKLAYGSYDVLLDGIVIASLTRDIDVSEEGWRIDLLVDTPPSDCPLPFDGQSRTFSSYQAALDWLGIYREVAPRRSASVRKSTRATPKYRTVPSPSDRYRLRLLAERNRFYAKTVGLNSLIWRGFIASTGRTDEEGRVEWQITETGRAALAKGDA